MQTLTAKRDAAAVAEDVGNIVSLEHVNVRIDDQSLATLFYIVGLGLSVAAGIQYLTHPEGGLRSKPS